MNSVGNCVLNVISKRSYIVVTSTNFAMSLFIHPAACLYFSFPTASIMLYHHVADFDRAFFKHSWVYRNSFRVSKAFEKGIKSLIRVHNQSLKGLFKHSRVFFELRSHTDHVARTRRKHYDFLFCNRWVRWVIVNSDGFEVCCVHLFSLLLPKISKYIIFLNFTN